MAPAHYQRPAGNTDFSNVAVVIIGSGFSGLCAAIHLLKRNIRNFVILEKSAGLGGTWRDNKYPGCCCDSAESLSFAVRCRYGGTVLMMMMMLCSLLPSL